MLKNMPPGSNTILRCLNAVFIAIRASLSETLTPEVGFNLLILKVIFPGRQLKVHRK